MKVKKVNRYYCDFCKKANCSGASISKHEKKCTLNPNRICGMCKIMQEVQPNLQNLIKILPNPKDYLEKKNSPYHWVNNDYDGLTKKLNEALPELRKLSNNCPVCIMAAIRQSGNQVPLVTDFDFKKEVEDIFAEINSLAIEEEYHRYDGYGY